MPTKEKLSPTANGQTKTAFVLGLPADVSAKEVVAKAKEAGVKLREWYVYAVRRKANMTRRRRRGRPAASAKIVIGRATGTEREFRRLALELGLGKAKELLRETERKVTAIIAGT